MTEPVRGLRVMAVLRWVLLGAVVAIAATTWIAAIAPDDHDARAARYFCPMHPQIRSPDRGTCPICYMNLEPIPDRDHAPPADAALADAGAMHELAPVMLTTERRQRAGITSVPARRMTVAGEARWPATIEAVEGARAEVRTRTDAFVERVLVREANVTVRAGQTLAWVYSPEILRAQEELLVAGGWQDDSGLAAAARERLILLGMGAREVDAMIASGRARRTIPLRAPIGGYVTRLEAVVGSYATPETLLFEITDLSRVRVVATPFAADVSWLGPETPARFEPRTGDAIPLSLDLVEPTVTAGTRALRVRFRAEATLRPGDLGEVVVSRPPVEAIVVPRDAIVDTGTVRYVFVEREGGVFEPRAVEIGALHGEDRVIERGLEVGERVVARGAFVLDSESRLQAALAPEEAP